MARLLSIFSTPINTFYVQSMPCMFCCWVNPQKVVYLATFIIFPVYFLRFIVQNLQQFRMEKFSVVFRPSVRILQPRKCQTLGLGPWELLHKILVSFCCDFQNKNHQLCYDLLFFLWTVLYL